MPEKLVVVANDGEEAPKESWLISLLIALAGLALVFGAKGLDNWADLLRDQGKSGHEPLHFLAYGFEHLGVVLIVAMVARKLIEEATERRTMRAFSAAMQREINQTSKNVSLAAISPLEGKIDTLVDNLSFRIANISNKPLQKQLVKSVLNPQFGRPEYLLRLKLKPLMDEGADKDLLEATVQLKYEVKNLTKRPAPYSIFCWIDDVIRLPSKQTHFTHIRWGTDKTRLIPGNIRELELQGQIERGDGVVVSRVNTGDIARRSSLYVDLEAVQLMRMEDHFVWNLAGLTQQMDIEVELQGGLTRENFCIYPREMHHIEHDAFHKTEQWEGNTLRMKIDQILLPFQGVEIRWAPNRAMTAGGAVVAETK